MRFEDRGIFCGSFASLSLQSFAGPARSPGLRGPAGGALTLPPPVLPLSPRCRISHNWILSPDHHLRYPANSTTTLWREAEQCSQCDYGLFWTGHLKMHRSYKYRQLDSDHDPDTSKLQHTELRNKSKPADTDGFSS